MKNTLRMFLLGAMLAFSSLISMQASAAITAPTLGSTLNGTNVTFSWANSGATAYWLTVGAVTGGSGYYNSGTLGSNVFSANVTGLPTKGIAIHARLYEMINGAWQITNYTYSASSVAVATIQNLTDGGGIFSNNPTITWNNVAADGYYLMLGTYLGGNDLFNSGFIAGNTTSINVTGLPNDKRIIYARLHTWGNGSWQISDTTYKLSFAATINSHANGATLAATTVTFSWAATLGAGAYYLDAGSSFNGHGDYFKSGIILPGTTSVVATGLPIGGVPVLVRLYTWAGNSWQVSDTTYTSAP